MSLQTTHDADEELSMGTGSSMTSPTTDVGSSGTIDSRSNSWSPRGHSNCSSTNTNARRISPKYRFRKSLVNTSNSDAHVVVTDPASAHSNDAHDGDIDTDHEGTSPSESTEEGESHGDGKGKGEKESSSSSLSKPLLPGQAAQINAASRQSQTPEDRDSPEKPPPAADAGTKLMRVTSFTAFSNPPMFDTEESERRYGKLTREKRRLHVSTGEFKNLRQHFTHERVAILISKVRSGSMNEERDCLE